MLYRELAQCLVESCDSPGSLNQALMELGATVCGVQVAIALLLDIL